MILLHGRMIETLSEQEYLKTLCSDCIKTLETGPVITAEKVIAACDRLYHKVMDGKFNDLLFPVLQAADISYDKFIQMAALFSREALEYKCQIELGGTSPLLPPLKNGIQRKRYPLGILFHIAAGNVDGLPAYSVIEGLLAGNINILKLPAGDNGFSVRLLHELILEEPDLKDYIYVFDVPSTEFHTLKTFADIADAVIVWGGDEAVTAARNMADITTKIIPWGHKLSFAYVTEHASEEELYRLALHICETNQVFCSSCQGIFLDTESPEKLATFGKRFFELLRKANKEKGKTDIGMRGKNAIRLYTDYLEHNHLAQFHQDGVSLVIKSDRELELSYLFRNVWVKALPRREMIRNLKKHKNHLQTCGLLCKDSDREELSHLLSQTGIVRITGPDMSRTVSGEAHDGIYPLLEYSRIVETDQ